MAWKRPAFTKVEGHRKLPEKASFEREAEVEVSRGAGGGAYGSRASPGHASTPGSPTSPFARFTSTTRAQRDCESRRAESPHLGATGAFRFFRQAHDVAKGSRASAGSAARARSLDTRARGHGQVTGDEGDLAGRDPDAGLHVQRDCPHHAVLRRRVQGERTCRLPGGASAAHAARTCPQPACDAL